MDSERRKCTICGGMQFAPGHGGRLSVTGYEPLCVSCRSVERHRIIRSFYDALAPMTKRMKALQFAPDNTLDPDQFAQLDFSTFEGENSLDMMDIKLPDSSYDLIASNHVLEHVEDQFLAIDEMLRVVGPDGLVHLSVPCPNMLLHTQDWGFADASRTHHFRHYGADAGLIFARHRDDISVMASIGRDPVTNVYDFVFWLSQSASRIHDVGHCLQKNWHPVLFIK